MREEAIRKQIAAISSGDVAQQAPRASATTVAGVSFASAMRSMLSTLSSVRLREYSFLARDLVSQNAPVTARLLGLRLRDQPRAHRLASLAVFSLGLLWLWRSPELSTGSAVACFAVVLALRFGFLFTSFVSGGVVARLKARFGVERGHWMYATGLDVLLFAQRVSFVALVFATSRAPDGLMAGLLAALGLPLLAAGVGASIWANRVVGLDAYHYRDLFTGSRSTNLESSGPYALCRNPMYVLGPLAGYGLALMALSPTALLAAGLNQALLLAFNEVVEQPRLRVANRIFVEAQYRYELARWLLGFDPRPELARRIHSDEPASMLDSSHAAM